MNNKSLFGFESRGRLMKVSITENILRRGNTDNRENICIKKGV